jgi:hypothetical protein
MTQNFLPCDRDQDFVLAPSVRDWLSAGHLAWFVLEVVERLDLHAIYGHYRADGSGRPAHEPGMMVALLVYAYCVGERSSRRIERRCVEDVAFRVIAANRAPDHTTISPLSAAVRGAAGRVVCAGAGDVPASGDGAGRDGRGRRDQDGRQRLTYSGTSAASSARRRNARRRPSRAPPPPCCWRPPRTLEGIGGRYFNDCNEAPTVHHRDAADTGVAPTPSTPPTPTGSGTSPKRS